MTDELSGLIDILQGQNEPEICEAVLKLNDLYATGMVTDIIELTRVLLSGSVNLSVTLKVRLVELGFLLEIEKAEREKCSEESAEITRLVLLAYPHLKDFLGYEYVDQMLSYLEGRGEDTSDKMALVLKINHDQDVERKMKNRIARMGENALPVLLKALENNSVIDATDIIKSMIWSSCAAMQELIDPLLNLLRSEPVFIKKYVIETLVEIEIKAKTGRIESAIVEELMNPGNYTADSRSVKEFEKSAFAGLSKLNEQWERARKILRWPGDFKYALEIGLEEVARIQRKYLAEMKKHGFGEKETQVTERGFLEFYIGVAHEKAKPKKDVPLADSPLARLTIKRMENRRERKEIRTFSGLQLRRVVA
ncbi:MAG: hypothetical protein WCT31_03745 [Candidatus Micrarchaeia archaeon]|jgi:hypothetical protein